MKPRAHAPHLRIVPTPKAVPPPSSPPLGSRAPAAGEAKDADDDGSPPSGRIVKWSPAFIEC